MIFVGIQYICAAIIIWLFAIMLVAQQKNKG